MIHLLCFFASPLSPLDLPLVQPVQFTEPVKFDADDPAVCYNSANPSRSYIIGTDKAEIKKKKGEDGALVVFDLKGKIISEYRGLDRPNNVDVLQGFEFGNRKINLVVTSERLKNQVRIFELNAAGKLIDLTGDTNVFVGDEGEDRAPMGIATGWLPGKKAGTRKWGVFVTPKAGKLKKHLEFMEFKVQKGKVNLVNSVRFGDYSGKKETESICFDAARGTIWYSDEGHGIWGYSNKALNQRTVLIQNPDHTGDHEGLAIWNDFLVNSDQRKDENVFWFYSLKGHKLVGGFRAPVDETDGIEICSRPLGAEFPEGILIAMNSKDRNFAIFDLRSLPKP